MAPGLMEYQKLKADAWLKKAHGLFTRCLCIGTEWGNSNQRGNCNQLFLFDFKWMFFDYVHCLLASYLEWHIQNRSINGEHDSKALHLGVLYSWTNIFVATQGGDHVFMNYEV